MLDKTALEQLYIEQQKTGPEIAEIAGVKSPTTIYTWLAKYDIPRRQRRAAQCPITPDKQTLEELYTRQRLSIDSIAKALGSSESSISTLLDQFDIPKRKRWEQMAGWNKGQSMPEEQRKNLSEIAKQRTGKKSPRYGAKLSRCTRRQISDSLKGRFRGPDNPQWKGGPRYRRQAWMSRYEYKEWRAAVFERDEYTCQMCDKPSNGNIQAHHIRPWSDFPELRFDANNGITLCESCHRSTKSTELEFAAQFDAILQANP